MEEGPTDYAEMSRLDRAVFRAAGPVAALAPLPGMALACLARGYPRLRRRLPLGILLSNLWLGALLLLGVAAVRRNLVLVVVFAGVAPIIRAAIEGQFQGIFSVDDDLFIAIGRLAFSNRAMRHDEAARRAFLDLSHYTVPLDYYAKRPLKGRFIRTYFAAVESSNRLTATVKEVRQKLDAVRRNAAVFRKIAEPFEHCLLALIDTLTTRRPEVIEDHGPPGHLISTQPFRPHGPPCRSTAFPEWAQVGRLAA